MSRRFWLRLNGILFALLFLACLGAAAWLSARHTMSWEWAGATQTRLSPASQRLISQLDEPVRVVLRVGLFEVGMVVALLTVIYF